MVEPVLCSYQEFIDAYRDSLGVEAASYIINEILEKQGWANKKEFTKEEAMTVCDRLKAQGGLVALVGGMLRARLVLRKK